LQYKKFIVAFSVATVCVGTISLTNRSSQAATPYSVAPSAILDGALAANVLTYTVPEELAFTPFPETPHTGKALALASEEAPRATIIIATSESSEEPLETAEAENESSEEVAIAPAENQDTEEQAPAAPVVSEEETPQDARTSNARVRTVPFYSQFTDITSPTWKKAGCGIASVAMLIDYYTTSAVSVDGLLKEGLAANSFIANAGWSHAGLIDLAKKRGLTGRGVDLAGSTMSGAFDALTTALDEGPVMASVHYTFEPTNPIPHLVVITGVKDGMVHYNDPAEKSGNGSITISKFQNSWKKRFIEIRPTS